MNKKIIVYVMAVVICILQCAGVSVYAGVDLTSGLEISGDTMHIYGKLDNGTKEEVLLRVMRVTASPDIDNDTIYIEQKSTNESGAYDFYVTLEDVATDQLPNTLEGFVPTKYVYSIGVIGATADYDSEEINFYGENYQKLAMKLINDEKTKVSTEATTVDSAAAAIKSVLDASYSRLYLAADIYEEYLLNPQNISDVMKYIAKQPKIETLADLKNQLNEATAVTMLKDCKNDISKVKEILDVELYRKALGINDTTALKSYNDFKSLCGDEMASEYANSSFETIAQSTKAFEFAVIKNALKECITTKQTEMLLGQNGSILGIDIQGYGLTDEESLRLSGMTIVNDLSEIKTKIIEIISDRSSSSGGGGGNAGRKPAGNTGGNNGIFVAQPSQVVGTDDAKKENVFSDLSGYSWAEDSIKELYNKGIVNGKADGVYDPSANVTREEFLKMLICALEIKVDSAKTASFEDVSASAWYADYVNTGFNNGIIKGISSDKFGIGNSIKREDAAVIAYRAMDNLSLINNEVEYECDFTDSGNISDYAFTAIGYMKNFELITGYNDGSFQANKTITRAEAAVLVDRIMNFAKRIL